jgi:hypothetical protein
MPCTRAEVKVKFASEQAMKAERRRRRGIGSHFRG